MNEHQIVTQNGEETELLAPADFGKGMSFVDPSQMPDLDSADVGINIQPEYIEFKNVGETFRAIYNGITEITTKDQQKHGEYKRIPAVVLQTKTGIKLNAGAGLVNQFRNLVTGVAVQITYKGEEKTNSGNKVKVYDVHLLNVPRVPLAVAPKVENHQPKKKYKNAHRATEYWTLVYSNKYKFTEDEGLAHLAEFDNDFAAAIEALEPSTPATF